MVTPLDGGPAPTSAIRSVQTFISTRQGPTGAPAPGAVTAVGARQPRRRPPAAPSCVWRHKQWSRRPARRAGPAQARLGPLPALAARPGAPQVRSLAADTSRNAMRMLAWPAVVAGPGGGGERRRRRHCGTPSHSPADAASALPGPLPLLAGCSNGGPARPSGPQQQRQRRRHAERLPPPGVTNEGREMRDPSVFREDEDDFIEIDPDLPQPGTAHVSSRAAALGQGAGGWTLLHVASSGPV